MAYGLRATTAAVAGILLVAESTSRAQSPLDAAAIALRTHAAMVALDRYMETWNSRNPVTWATSLHFPHVRPGPGAFELSRTPAEYAAGVDFQATIKTGCTANGSRAKFSPLVTAANGVPISFSKMGRNGQALSRDEALVLVTLRDNQWRVQARSTIVTELWQVNTAPGPEVRASKSVS